MKELTRNRIIFFILWALSLAGISFYGGSVSYGFFMLMTLIPVISFLYVIYVFFVFRIFQNVEGKNLVAGKLAPFYFTLMNENFIGFCFIKVRFFSSFSSIVGLDPDEEYSLLPKSGVRKNTSLLCLYRGEYEVGIKTVEIRDYFGLIRLRYRNKETMQVIVKPKLTELSDLIEMDLSQTMARESAAEPYEPDVLVREYEYGDDPRLVNWKVSARTGQLMIRKETGLQRDGVMILMGTERTSHDNKVYLPLENKILELTLALAMHFTRNNTGVRVCYLENGLVIKDAAGTERFEQFYEEFSAVRFSESSKEDKLVEEASGAAVLAGYRMVFFVLTKWADDLAKIVSLFHAQHIYTHVFFVSDEESRSASFAQSIPGLQLSYVKVHGQEEDGMKLTGEEDES
ncbi:MAG: DUF58 domain-containing protein [Lachnospiraceae bacterium]|nr:DUF58 domain-containing protein [Lachnospiraceae bacterium]